MTKSECRMTKEGGITWFLAHRHGTAPGFLQALTQQPNLET
ncbi:MAG: hypothetical protein JWM16_5217 [Verrucomicrobiales bacterium]|nr:hypothetical protein [Verrucomicrobiales bacterium]